MNSKWPKPRLFFRSFIIRSFTKIFQKVDRGYQANKLPVLQNASNPRALEYRQQIGHRLGCIDRHQFIAHHGTCANAEALGVAAGNCHKNVGLVDQADDFFFIDDRHPRKHRTFSHVRINLLQRIIGRDGYNATLQIWPRD